MKSSPSLDIISQSLILFLNTMLQLCQTSRSLAGALKCFGKHSGQFFPIENAPRGQLIQPGSGKILKHQREVFHAHLIVATTNVHSHSVILQPSVGLRLSGELTYARRQPEVVRDLSGSDGSSEALRARNVHSASAGSISIQAFSVCFVPVDQTLYKD